MGAFMRIVVMAVVMVVAVMGNAATFQAGHPSTTDNDDSCDIALMPAATLLLPYFEVDVTSPQTKALTTLFTVTNTTQYPQIARVTIWSDLGFPTLNFNVFLTGYDVQSINLYDVLVRGVVAPPSGTSSLTEPGFRSMANNSNPNFAPDAAAQCEINPGPIPNSIRTDVLSALTAGRLAACGSSMVGLTHANAIGYATIDVVKSCTVTLPIETAYYNDLLYDNALTGDFSILNPNDATGNYAAGNPLVHIRAIPEGGAAATFVATNLPYTFYDRYTPRATPSIDRRQPLPAAFSARYIQGGTGAFNTNFEVWREGVTGGGAACSDYKKNFGNAAPTVEIVRFDEHENPYRYAPCQILCTPLLISLPEASSTASSSGLFPPVTGSDVGGWMFMNLSNGGSASYSKSRHSQNWVVVSMYAEGRYSVAFDATMMANGCTAAPAAGAPIAPGPNAAP